MSKPWFRVYTEIVDDEKLRLLAFEDRWHFIALLSCKGAGIIDESNKALMRRKVAVKLGLDVATLDEVARRLAEVELINADTLQPLGWDRRQFASDHDPTGSTRQRRFREKQKEDDPSGNAPITDYPPVTNAPITDYPPVTNAPVTQASHLPEADTDTDTDTDTETPQEERAAETSPRASARPRPHDGGSSQKGKGAPMAADWFPGEAAYSVLTGLGIPRPFAEGCIPEFRLYWTERGDARPGWEASFVNSVKRSWDKRPRDQVVKVMGQRRPGQTIAERITEEHALIFGRDEPDPFSFLPKPTPPPLDTAGRLIEGEVLRAAH